MPLLKIFRPGKPYGFLRLNRTFRRIFLHFSAAQEAGVHFLNHYNLGGPLIYQSGGSFRVFIDGRADTAYPAWALNDYVAFFRFATFGEEADNITARYNLGGLILPRDSGDAKAAAQNPKWRRAFDGENAVVFVRK